MASQNITRRYFSQEPTNMQATVCHSIFFTLQIFWQSQMSHWRHKMVDGADFCISCKRLKILRIQDLVTTTIICICTSLENSYVWIKYLFQKNLTYPSLVRSCRVSKVLWGLFGSFGALWGFVRSQGVLSDFMGSCGGSVGSHEILWDPVGSCGVSWVLCNHSDAFWPFLVHWGLDKPPLKIHGVLIKYKM